MNIFKALFGGKEIDAAEEEKRNAEKRFEMYKFDGVKALRTNQPALAADFLSKALAIKPDDLETVDYLSQAYLAEGKTAEAYEQLELLADAQPDNVAILVRMANVAYMMESYTVMSNVCEKAMLVEPDNAQVMFLYARACIAQGDNSNGIAMLSKTIMLKDDLYDAYLLRSQSYLDCGDVDDADADADFLLEKVGEQEDICMQKGKIAKQRGEKQLAVQWFSKAIDANPFCEQAFKERCEIYKELGDNESAANDEAMVGQLTTA